jgi:Mrp family chromosome partitioning ATPase/capsular polysaccharide biosynthesis protein
VATVNRHVTPTDGTIVPSLLDYLRVLGRRKYLLLLIVIVVPATAVALSLSQAPKYRASADVLLTPADTGGQPVFFDPQRVAQTQAQLARVPDVVDQVLDAVPNAELEQEEFLKSSSVSTTLGSDLLTFSVENSDPRLATELATEYANAFAAYREQLPRALGPSADVVRIPVEAPKVGPRTPRNGLIAFCLGLVLALVVVFLADALDTRVRSVDTIREALGLRLLGRLAPPSSRLRNHDDLVMLADPTSHNAEQFRALRWSLDLANADHGAQAIMITSAVDGEGKSTTAANLAVALARAGRRVVLIDADLAHPHLHRLFDLDQQPGLTDVELGGTSLVDALRPISLTEDSSEADDSSRRTGTGSLEVLPAGSVLQDPDELGFDRAVGRIIQQVWTRADIMLVDAPPVLSGHALALSAHVDAIVVVVRLKALRTSALEDLGWTLEASPAVKLGFVVTGDDGSEGYGQSRYGLSDRRRAVRPRLKLTVPPSAADGDSDARGRAAEPERGNPRGVFFGEERRVDAAALLFAGRVRVQADDVVAIRKDIDRVDVGHVRIERRCLIGRDRLTIQRGHPDMQLGCPREKLVRTSKVELGHPIVHGHHYGDWLGHRLFSLLTG